MFLWFGVTLFIVVLLLFACCLGCCLIYGAGGVYCLILIMLIAVYVCNGYLWCEVSVVLVWGGLVSLGVVGALRFAVFIVV